MKKHFEGICFLVKSSLLQIIKKMKEGPFGDIKKFRKKISQRKKGRGSLIAPKKIEKGDPSALEGFLEALDAVKIKY